MVSRAAVTTGDDATGERSSAEERPLSNPRYQLGRKLGEGGMAAVYDALDRARGSRVALKRLQVHADPIKQRRNAELFELEFHTLAQLAHPRVVEVYDFGIDPSGLYYTMELLDGGDLQQLAPLPWRTACSLARDVCSALSLLHSRRFVHRDISPRNVRRTEAGVAKLIDFGALAVMGTSKLLVGTPPCCPPESVHLQALDGRTDLYSLGATLYYVLVGHHAFGARNFAVLQETWQNGFPPPSAFVPEVPAALDALVTELLRLDPDARPASAAEVAQRLAAIEGATLSEELQMAQAYLATPMLVGRAPELARVSRRLKRTVAGEARSVVVEGPAGVGRSRLLDAAVLDATLLGLATARADADDARSGEYGVAAALIRQLWNLAPENASEAAQPYAAALARLVPALVPSVPAAPAAVGDTWIERAQLAEALAGWFRAIAASRPLLIAIDDFHRIDNASASLFALLASEQKGERLGVLASAQLDVRENAPVALKRLREVSTTIALGNLSRNESEELLRFLFGDLPKLPLLAYRAHELSGGNPRDLMRLAQHLIDRGAIRYVAGAWSVAGELNELALPNSMAQALQTRVAALRESARELAWSLALCPDQLFTPGECATLCDAPDPAALLADLEALTHADLVRRLPGAVGLAHSSWVPILRELLSPERAAIVHHRLAGVFQRRGDLFRAGGQWLRGGQTARALDALVAFVEVQLEASAREDTVRSRIEQFRTPAPDWFEIYARAIRACDELGRPPKHKLLLLIRQVALCAIFDVHDRVHVALLLSQLRHDSGLDDYAALADAAPSERLALALTRAQERYQSTPEEERVLDPISAIRQLARAIGSALAIQTRAMDIEGLAAIPDLGPLTPLAPSLRVLAMAVDALGARLHGRLVHARAVYEELLALLLQPDRAGLDATMWELTRHAVSNVLGMIEAAAGSASCLARAESLRGSAAYEVNAVVIAMLHALFQGDTAEADNCRKQIDRLRIQNGSRQMFEGMHLIWELDAHAIAEDLTRLRHAIDQLTPLAQRYPGWRPVARCAEAELQRICGAGARALVEIEATLELAKPGEHQVWASAAACELRVLLDLGRAGAALARADAHLASAQVALGEVPPALSLLRGLALASAGQASADDDPDAQAERVIAGMIAQGVSGLQLGYAHELRARTALGRGDHGGFSRFAEECGAIYGRFRNPALSAKLQRLRDAARSGQTAGTSRASGLPDSVSMAGPSRIAYALQACRDAEQRNRLALTLLLRQSGGEAGFLFSLSERGLDCVASLGGITLPESLARRMEDYLAAEASGEVTTHTDSEVSATELNEWLDDSGRGFRPVLLSHHLQGRVVITGAALIAVPPNGRFVYPIEAAREISRHAEDAGGSTLLVPLA